MSDESRSEVPSSEHEVDRVLGEFVERTKRNSPGTYLAFLDEVRLREAMALPPGPDRDKEVEFVKRVIDIHGQDFSVDHVYPDGRAKVKELMETLYARFRGASFSSPAKESQFNEAILPSLRDAREELKIPPLPKDVGGYPVGGGRNRSLPPGPRPRQTP